MALFASWKKILMGKDAVVSGKFNNQSKLVLISTFTHLARSIGFAFRVGGFVCGQLRFAIAA
jgi:hypothetical protein